MIKKKSHLKSHPGAPRRDTGRANPTRNPHPTCLPPTSPAKGPKFCPANREATRHRPAATGAEGLSPRSPQAGDVKPGLAGFSARADGVCRHSLLPQPQPWPPRGGCRPPRRSLAVLWLPPKYCDKLTVGIAIQSRTTPSLLVNSEAVERVDISMVRLSDLRDDVLLKKKKIS